VKNIIYKVFLFIQFYNLFTYFFFIYSI